MVKNFMFKTFGLKLIKMPETTVLITFLPCGRYKGIFYRVEL